MVLATRRHADRTSGRRELRLAHLRLVKLGLALTGRARAQDREATSVAGFDAHVTKPIDPAALVRLVASLTPRPPAPPEV